MAKPSSQQGWWEWLSGSSASAEISSPSNERCEPPADDNSQKAKVSSVATSSSPYGPYVRTGRGGAGNFQWQSEKKERAQDVEAQDSRSLDEQREITATMEHLDTKAAVQKEQARSSAPKYIRVGRGGAGNMPLVDDERKSVTAPLAPSTATPIPAMYTGRGGAGNFAAAATVNEETELARLKDERAEAEKQRAKAESRVKDLIQPPGQAWLAGKDKNFVSEETEP